MLKHITRLFPRIKLQLGNPTPSVEKVLQHGFDVKVTADIEKFLQEEVKQGSYLAIYPEIRDGVFLGVNLKVSKPEEKLPSDKQTI